MDLSPSTSTPSPYILPISAGVSGIAEASMTHWLDRIKTKMQELTLEHKNGSLQNSIKTIYSESGFVGFYSGIVPRVIGIIPMRIIYWSTMIKMNSLVENQKPIVKYVFPGLVAGSVQTILDNPIEAVKIQLMTRGANNTLPPILNIKSIDCIKKLYVGFVPCVLRNSIFAVVVASTVKKYGQKQEHKFMAGAIGGLVGSILSHPFDVAKTELQRYKKINDTNNIISKQKSSFVILSEIAKENPLQLWSGGLMRCVLAFFNMGIGFYTLGYIQKTVSEIIY